MKYMRQVGIIWGMTLAGELLNSLLPFPVPAGVYGLFLLLAALLLGVVKLESVEGTGNFLLDIMPMLFVPSTVGLIEYADQIKEIWLPYALIITCSTVAVMVSTGWLAQRMVESKERKRGRQAKDGPQAAEGTGGQNRPEAAKGPEGGTGEARQSGEQEANKG